MTGVSLTEAKPDLMERCDHYLRLAGPRSPFAQAFVRYAPGHPGILLIGSRPSVERPRWHIKCTVAARLLTGFDNLEHAAQAAVLDALEPLGSALRSAVVDVLYEGEPRELIADLARRHEIDPFSGAAIITFDPAPDTRRSIHPITPRSTSPGPGAVITYGAHY
jgi:hypothetical protein